MLGTLLEDRYIDGPKSLLHYINDKAKNYPIFGEREKREMAIRDIVMDVYPNIKDDEIKIFVNFM